jgi:hypothetical protein
MITSRIALQRALILRTLTAWAALGLLPASACGAPDLDGAIAALVSGPLAATGDALGGAGLVAAAGCGSTADVVALVDANRLTSPLLRGTASRTLLRLALGLSWTSTGLLEGLRGEDIERLPEARATYLSAAPGVGRVETLTGGIRSLGLALSDALSTPPLVILRLVGARGPAERLARRQENARIDALGPLPSGGSARHGSGG